MKTNSSKLLSQVYSLSIYDGENEINVKDLKENSRIGFEYTIKLDKGVNSS